MLERLILQYSTEYAWKHTCHISIDEKGFYRRVAHLTAIIKPRIVASNGERCRSRSRQQDPGEVWLSQVT